MNFYSSYDSVFSSYSSNISLYLRFISNILITNITIIILTHNYFIYNINYYLYIPHPSYSPISGPIIASSNHISISPDDPHSMPIITSHARKQILHPSTIFSINFVDILSPIHPSTKSSDLII
jgi:hypothetical protein